MNTLLANTAYFRALCNILTMLNRISTVLFCTILVSMLQGQVTTISDDFEGNGTISTWFGDDCQINTSFANPYMGAANPSATVLRYGDVGGSFANVRFTNEEKFNLNSGSTFSIKIYVPSASLSGSSPNQVSLKLQNADLAQPWVTQTEIIKPISLDTWQTVVFDFSSGEHINLDPNSPAPLQRLDLDRVVIQVNGENNNNAVIAFVDDLTYDGTLGYDPDESNSVFDELVWSDEFENDGPVDASKWHHQTQLPNSFGWFNGELQHYTDRTDNSFVQAGELHIVAKRENFDDQGLLREFTSARLNSKFAFTNGRVEVRAKLPQGGGTWPAIWMLGKNITEAGGYWASQYGDTPWPACGEIDIMEHWGWNQNYVSSALHTPSSFGGTVNVGGTTLGDVTADYHIYGMEWTETEIRFTVDGVVFYTYAPAVQNGDTWPFTADQYILLNVAMESSTDAAFQESEMIIDYVRVYQEEPLPSDEVSATFTVNINSLDTSAVDAVYLSGSFNGWCGDCDVMTHLGDGLWSLERIVPMNQDIFYHFIADGSLSLSEYFDAEDACAGLSGAMGQQRQASIGSSDIVLDAVCFGSCGPCDLSGTCITDLNGDGITNVNDLLILISQYGDECGE